MKKKTKWVDDGRTIANMNVEGMPWYNPAKDNKDNTGSPAGDGSQETARSRKKARSELTSEPLGIKETLAMTKGALLAALLVAAVFVVVFLLFILFSTKIWIR